MKTRTVGVDRIVTLLLAVVLVAGGAMVVLWRLRVEFARDAFAHADRRWYAAAPAQAWWDWALALVTVAAMAFGLWLLVANLRPNRVGSIPLVGTDALGTHTVNPGQIGNAVTAMLTRHQEVRSASARAVVDRGRRTLRMTLVADPDVSIEQLRRLAAETAADIDAALEDADVALQFYVRYLPARHS